MTTPRDTKALLERARRFLDHDFDHYTATDAGTHWMPLLMSALAASEREVEVAEGALLRHGYRKSCDIPACNCGDQWNHGGNAWARLQEIDDVLPYENGKTILQRVEGLVAEVEALKEHAADVAGLCTTALDALADAVGHPENMTDADRVIGEALTAGVIPPAAIDAVTSATEPDDGRGGE